MVNALSVHVLECVCVEGSCSFTKQSLGSLCFPCDSTQSNETNERRNYDECVCY